MSATRKSKLDDFHLTTLYYNFKSDTDIAKEIGCSSSGVCRARHRLGLTANYSFGGQKNKLTPEQMYKKFLKNNKKWKKENPMKVKEQFKEYQKEHRTRLSLAEKLRRWKKKEFN